MGGTGGQRAMSDLPACRCSLGSRARVHSAHPLQTLPLHMFTAAPSLIPCPCPTPCPLRTTKPLAGCPCEPKWRPLRRCAACRVWAQRERSPSHPTHAHPAAPPSSARPQLLRAVAHRPCRLRGRCVQRVHRAVGKAMLSSAAGSCTRPACPHQTCRHALTHTHRRLRATRTETQEIQWLEFALLNCYGSYPEGGLVK